MGQTERGEEENERHWKSVCSPESVLGCFKNGQSVRSRDVFVSRVLVSSVLLSFVLVSFATFGFVSSVKLISLLFVSLSSFEMFVICAHAYGCGLNPYLSAFCSSILFVSSLYLDMYVVCFLGSVLTGVSALVIRNNNFLRSAIFWFVTVYMMLPLYAIMKIVDSNACLSTKKWVIIYAILGAKLCDMCAYIVGTLLGRRFVLSVISAKKTLEGFCASIIGGCIFGLCMYKLAPCGIHKWFNIMAPICIGVVSQFGDLVESSFKRCLGVKESGRIKGLGGALDIMDSSVFVLPLFYVGLFS